VAQVSYGKQIAALPVVEPYNDFISEVDKAWDGLKAVAETNGCIPNMLEVLTAARKVGLRVFYSPHRRYPRRSRPMWGCRGSKENRKRGFMASNKIRQHRQSARHRQSPSAARDWRDSSRALKPFQLARLIAVAADRAQLVGRHLQGGSGRSWTCIRRSRADGRCADSPTGPLRRRRWSACCRPRLGRRPDRTSSRGTSTW